LKDDRFQEHKGKVCMKKIIHLFAFWLATSTALAQGTFVVPNALANTEGNSSSAALFGPATLRVLQVYSASEFGLPPGASGLVSSVAFRLDGASGQTFSGFWPGAGIVLSTTPRAPDSLSSVYSENIGSDAVSVFNNTFLIRATNASVSPRSFEVVVPFSTPFWYDPSQGNLSMALVTGGGGTSLLLDAQDTFGDGVGRAFENGTVDTVGFVTRFDMTVVPEPGVTSFVVIAVLFFAGLSRFHRFRKDL
jgi:hypothetical protein